MRVFHHFSAIAIATAACAAPATAQTDGIPARGVFKTGQQVFDRCIRTDQPSIDTCEWFLMGGYDMAVYYQDIGEIKATFCAPIGLNAVQLRGVAVSYWRANPGSLKYSAVSSLINALSEKYPGACKK